MGRLLLYLGLVAGLALVACLLAWIFQRRLIYFPSPLSGLFPVPPFPVQ